MRRLFVQIVLVDIVASFYMFVFGRGGHEFAMIFYMSLFFLPIYLSYMWFIQQFTPPIFAFSRFKTLLRCFIYYFLQFTVFNVVLQLSILTFELLFSLFYPQSLTTYSFFVQSQLFVITEILYLLIMPIEVASKKRTSFVVMFVLLGMYVASTFSSRNMSQIWNLFAYYKNDVEITWQLLLHYGIWILIAIGNLPYASRKIRI